MVPYLIFLKGCVISLARLPLVNKTKQKVFSYEKRVFGQKFTRKAKNGFECLKLDFCNC